MATKEVGLHTVFVNERAKSRQLRKATLVVTDGPDQGQEFAIEKSKVFVGRTNVNDIVLADSSISSTHFELRAEEDGFLLKDLGSTNGTYLAGCRVREIFVEPEGTVSRRQHDGQARGERRDRRDPP